MTYVMIAVFVVVMAAALVVLLGMAIGAFSAMFTGMRDDMHRRRSAARLQTDNPLPARVPEESPADPLGDLADTLREAQARRWESCQSIRERLDGYPADDGEIDAGGFILLALEIWRGRSAEGADDGSDAPEGRLRHRGHDADDLDRFSSDPIGQIAWMTAAVAERISDLPAWRLDFFDRHSVRVDLNGEVTAIARAAVGLRDQFAVLGDAPSGHLACDPEVVSTFSEKSLLLSGRLDELVRRLEAFAGYEQIVTRIQQRQEKQAWLDRVGGVDDFEHAIATEWDRAQADRVRHMADESDALASIYLDEIAPLAKSLKRN